MPPPNWAEIFEDPTKVLPAGVLGPPRLFFRSPRSPLPGRQLPDGCASPQIFSLSPQPLFLDVGCGYGRFLLQLCRSRNDVNFVGMEARPQTPQLLELEKVVVR